MSTLTWTPDLQLGLAPMDATHEEFVVLLADCEAALHGDLAQLIARWNTLVDHTVEHFAQEDRWMVATGFAPENCHSYQHQAVLAVMRECARRAALPEAPDVEPLRLAVAELAIWFPQHAQMMDAALAQHLASVGFDPASGTVAICAAAASAPITGCGGGSCSPTTAAATAATDTPATEAA